LEGSTIERRYFLWWRRRVVRSKEEEGEKQGGGGWWRRLNRPTLLLQNLHFQSADDFEHRFGILSEKSSGKVADGREGYLQGELQRLSVHVV
jgi:hypothetical protein